MIEHLRVGWAAYFFQRRRRITNSSIDVLFRRLRSGRNATGRDLFRARRQGHAGATFSAICFPFERTPSFLDEAAGVKETVYGFMLLVEKGSFVAVLKAGLDLPSSFKGSFLRQVDDVRMERAIAHRDAVFEKVALRNTSVSKLALRSKTLEANDLANAVSSSSASRFVPQRYSLRRSDGSYSATPSTGRISKRADREDHIAAVDWAVSIIDALSAEEGETSDFIRTFARQLSLEQLGESVRPRHVAIDVAALTDMLFGDQTSIRLVEEDGDSITALGRDRVEALLADLDRGFPVEQVRSELQVRDPTDGARLASLKIGKARLTLSGFAPAAAGGVMVERVDLPVGGDEERRPLARYIDREQLFTVLFDDLALAYLNGRLYKDEALLGGGASFMRHLHACAGLEGATSEKGAFVVGQTSFEPGSVFRTVVDEVAAADDVLVCDDLGDEWADFIGVRTNDDRVTIDFYHAKHGDASMSASAFHEAVGQGIKNLGRMALPTEAMPPKLDKWRQTYRNANVTTAISRVIRGGGIGDVDAHVAEARMAPDLQKRVHLVTSSLSREAVQAVFDAVQAGGRPSAHFVQLYWLLTSFFTACAEMGAVGYVVCRP